MPMAHEILVVDDNKQAREALGRMCRQNGFQPVLAHSFDEAQLVLSNPQISLVGAMLDVVLPAGRTGVEIATLIRREIGNDIPIAVVSGYAADPSLIENIADQIDVVLIGKPIARHTCEVFMRYASMAHLDLARSVRDAVLRMSFKFALSVQETRILAHISSGCSRQRLPDEIGISNNTIKRQVRRLLRSTDTRDTKQITCLLLDELARPSSPSSSA
jgi:DNA-binding NarL/FixJ family response regulator